MLVAVRKIKHEALTILKSTNLLEIGGSDTFGRPCLRETKGGVNSLFYKVARGTFSSPLFGPPSAFGSHN